jgi:hypothetical protein
MRLYNLLCDIIVSIYMFSEVGTVLIYAFDNFAVT